MISSKLTLRGIFLLFSSFLLASSAQAQFKASVQGTVTDPNGGVVSNATVTVKNPQTGLSRETVTSSAGFYRISELAPGNYSVTVKAAGFKESTTNNVIVAAELPRGFDVQLQIGEVNQQVTVTAAGGGLQTEDANITGTITNEQLQRLPVFGRDPYELLKITPGIAGDGSRSGAGQSVGFPNGHGANSGGTSGGTGGSNTAIFQTENQQPISANGQRVTSNDYLVDGVSVNSLQWGGAATLTPSIESVQEITVLSVDYDATDGRSSGAHIKVVTKSGTNQFHGAGFFQYQSPGLNAYNKFNGFNANSDT
ncbi:MAG: carboxypeptidase regulatory-like domain-containing protein, partial [Candidatus Acidiferrum sp.]